MFEDLGEDLKQHMDLVTAPILTQVTKTNGRVNRHDDDIVSYKVWRGWMTGGMAVIMIILPLVISFLTWVGLSVIKFDHQISSLSEKL